MYRQFIQLVELSKKSNQPESKSFGFFWVWIYFSLGDSFEIQVLLLSQFGSGQVSKSNWKYIYYVPSKQQSNSNRSIKSNQFGGDIIQCPAPI